MGLTGTGIQIGSATQFGASVRFPRGLASDGTTLYMFSSSIAYTLGDTTGIATQIGSKGLGAGVDQIRAATYHDGNIIIWANSEKRFYTVSSAGVATENGAQFTISWDFWAIASLGGVLYAIDRARDSLYVIDLTNAAATRVGTADEFDVRSGNVQAFTAYRDELIGISSDLDKILRVNATDGTAEIIANANTLPDVSPEAAAEHNGNLLMLGSSADALFRLYDVLWDETIDDLEVDESSDETWDLSAISQDAASLSLQGSPPSWLSVSGTDLVATSAPDVDSDQNNDVMVRATRDGVNVEKTLRVVVKNTGTPPPTNTAPEFANASYTFDNVAVADNTTVGTVAATDADSDTLTYSLTGTDNAKFDISSSGVITNAEALDYETTYNINVVAHDGTDTTSVGVTVTTADLEATTLEIISGDTQSAQVSTALANALIVQVNDQNGDAFSGEAVTFSTTGGTLSETSVTTGSNGQASTALTLPSTAGDYTVTAAVSGLTDVEFTATATATQADAVSIAKAKVFSKQLNTTTTPAVAGDNDLSTHTTQTTVTCELTNTAFDHIFLMMSGVTSYIVSVDGVALPSRTVPSHLSNVPVLGDVSISRHGWQHDLWKLDAPRQGDALEIVFTGSSVRVAEVMVLKQIASIEKLEAIAHAKVDTDSDTVENYLGETYTKQVTGSDALRWVSNCTIEFTHDDENWEYFADLIEDNIEGIVWAQEPDRKPWRVYRAIFSQDRYDAPYLSETKPGGNRLSFEVKENRQVSAAWFSLDTFNTNATGDGVMFFRDCEHLGENGAVDDRDPDTSSTDTTHTFDVDGVSHVYLHATGVTSFAVQTLVSNVWTTQETVTPTQKTYRSWDHSLSKLTNRVTDTQVRLVFTGTNVRINEILCLDIAGEILTDQQALLSKVFRKAVTHETSRGGFVRTTVPGAERMKWALQMNNTFGHLDTFDAEDFMDWLTLHGNFVISYMPNLYPWRTFPTTTEGRRFENVFLTRILQNGEAVACGIIQR